MELLWFWPSFGLASFVADFVPSFAVAKNAVMVLHFASVGLSLVFFLLWLLKHSACYLGFETGCTVFKIIQLGAHNLWGFKSYIGIFTHPPSFSLFFLGFIWVILSLSISKESVRDPFAFFLFVYHCSRWKSVYHCSSVVFLLGIAMDLALGTAV